MVPRREICLTDLSSIFESGSRTFPDRDRPIAMTWLLFVGYFAQPEATPLLRHRHLGIAYAPILGFCCPAGAILR